MAITTAILHTIGRRRIGESRLAGFFTQLFGCQHRNMSRPFTHDGQSYRACLDCGAHRRFDTEKWEMTGNFYYEA